MKNEEVRNILGQIFREIAPEIEWSKIDTTRPLRNQAEIDSFDFYRIIVQIAKRTGVNIPNSKLSEFKNLDELITFVSESSNHHPQQSPGQ